MTGNLKIDKMKIKLNKVSDRVVMDSSCIRASKQVPCTEMGKMICGDVEASTLVQWVQS